MAKILPRGAVGLVVLAGVSITWTPFHSTLYPYSLSQPSSFKHAVLTLDASSQKVDYFSPPLGSSVTNVTIVATPGDPLQNALDYLKSIDGHHIHRSGWISLAGARRPLIRADFDGYPGKWTVEEVSFAAAGYYWRLSMSYARQFKNLRSTMLRMIQSFKPGSGSAH
jgi:hypothetical protein